MGKVLKNWILTPLDFVMLFMFIRALRYFGWRTGHPALIVRASDLDALVGGRGAVWGASELMELWVALAAVATLGRLVVDVLRYRSRR